MLARNLIGSIAYNISTHVQDIVLSTDVHNYAYIIPYRLYIELYVSTSTNSDLRAVDAR